MPSMAEVRADPAIRNSQVRKSVLRGNGEVLFLLAVDQYNAKPGKQKAIAIFDIFCDLSGNNYELVLGKLVVGDLIARSTEYRNLSGHIQWYQELKGRAGQMNSLKRWWTKDKRAVAAAGLFDFL